MAADPPLRLSPAVTVAALGDRVVLRSDLASFQLEGSGAGAFVQEVLPLLDGTRPAGEIADAVTGYSRSSVLSVLDTLIQRGLVEAGAADGADDVLATQRRWFRRLAPDPELHLQQLREGHAVIVGAQPWGVVAALQLAASGVRRITVATEGTVGAYDVATCPSLARAGAGSPRADAIVELLRLQSPSVECSAAPVDVDALRAIVEPHSALVVVALPADDVALLRRIAMWTQESRVRCLHAELDGEAAVLGPVVIPAETACWACMHERDLATRSGQRAQRLLDARLSERRPIPRDPAHPPVFSALLGNLAAIEATTVLSGMVTQAAGALVVHDLRALTAEIHQIVRLPWCDVCGGEDAAGGSRGATAESGDEDSSPSPGSADDPSRLDPAALRRRFAGWVGPRVGVVNHLAVREPPQEGPHLPVLGVAYLSDYPHVQGEERFQLRGGKGMTRGEAMFGALAEAIEHYSAFCSRPGALPRCTASELPGDVLRLGDLARLSDEQLANLGLGDAQPGEDDPIHWVRGRWLDDRSEVWVPAAEAFLDFPESRPLPSTSNGLAAGLTLDDAFARAAWELVERDAFTITWLSRRPAVRLDPVVWADVECREALRQTSALGADIELYLLDAGLGIPVVCAAGFGDGADWPGATVALGCHPDLRVAVRKAILEQGQIGPQLRDAMRTESTPVPRTPDGVVDLDSHPAYYFPAERAAAFDFLRARRFEPVPADATWGSDLTLDEWARRVRARGVRVAAVDVTSPDVRTSPFRVARALGPGFQPLDFGAAAVRLANPRLAAFLQGPPNPDPHPLG